jgi:hypothetical protein
VELFWSQKKVFQEKKTKGLIFLSQLPLKKHCFNFNLFRNNNKNVPHDPAHCVAHADNNPTNQLLSCNLNTTLGPLQIKLLTRYLLLDL